MNSRHTWFLFLVTLTSISCVSTSKPIKPMIFASASMKAAERALAERLAPDLYRRAEVKFWSARKNYMQKNFEYAEKDAKSAKALFEKAEIKAALKAAEDSEEE